MKIILYFLLLYITVFLNAQEIGILKENGFPYTGTDGRITPDLIKNILVRWYPEENIKFLSVEELEKGNLKNIKVFIHPYGESYPEEKADILFSLFSEGKTWINLGGWPFSVPVKKVDNKWVVQKRNINLSIEKLHLPLTAAAGAENTSAKPDVIYLTDEGEKIFGFALQMNYMVQPNLKWEGKWRYSFGCTPEIVRFNPYWIEKGDYVFNLANALASKIEDNRLAKGSPLKKGEGVISILEFGSEPYLGSKFVLFGFCGENSPLVDRIFGKQIEKSNELPPIPDDKLKGKKVFNENDILLERLLPPLVKYALEVQPSFYIFPEENKPIDVFYIDEPIKYRIKIHNPTDKKISVKVLINFIDQTVRYSISINPKEIKYLPVKFKSSKLGIYPLEVKVKYGQTFTPPKIYPVTVVQKVPTDKNSFAGINSLPHPANEKFFDKTGFITHLELMKYGGISFLHGGFPHMNHIYKNEGVFKWGEPDHEFVHEQLEKYGLFPHGNVVGMTQWAAALNSPKATEWWWAPPKDIKYWRNYVEEGMKKLGHRLDEVTVWGEMWGLTPEQYVEMFNVVTDVTKKLAPHIKVGGPVTGWIDLEMIEKVLKECPDIGAIDFHTYYGSQCWGWSGGWENMIEDIKRVKKLMEKYNRQNLPIWITEMGKSISACFETEEIQSSEMVKGITVARAEGVSRIFWFSFRSSVGNKEFEYSILRSPRFPKPAYVTYNNLINLLKDAEIDSQKVKLLSYPDSLEKPEEQIFTFLFRNNKSKNRIFIGWTSEPKPRTGWKFGPPINIKVEMPFIVNKIWRVDLYGNTQDYRSFKKSGNTTTLELALSDFPTILILK